MESFKQRLIEVLSIPSYTGKEDAMRQYLVDFFTKKEIDHYVDTHGNVYATKGVSDVYPCLVAHIDTVHKLDEIIVKEKDGHLYAVNPHGRRVGIGGDDKAGVFIALDILEQTDVMKVAFFVAEEVGCLGSYLSDKKFFENVGYAIQFDAPFNNWVSQFSDGEMLFDVEGAFFDKIEPVLEEHMHKYDRYRCLGSHPYTDVSALKRLYQFSCINFSAGYIDMHSPYEKVCVKDVHILSIIGKQIVDALGCKKYPFQSYRVITEEFLAQKERRLTVYRLDEGTSKPKGGGAFTGSTTR